ncbi:MAG TPA: hypothetical protein VF503_02430 [Sphingobium sp.]|uniref:hypothetical protein n=1 Tax=Sphingobium sp. TaxID=1912891 RepID=UPI002ED19278
MAEVILPAFLFDRDVSIGLTTYSGLNEIGRPLRGRDCGALDAAFNVNYDRYSNKGKRQ